MKIDYEQLDFIDQTLRDMVADVYFPMTLKLGEPTITSLYRIGDAGVHGTLPVRGMDIRCYADTVGSAIADYVNARWQYDPSRPHKVCCMYHDVGQGAHLHFQVHPNTVKIEGNK